MLTIEDPEIDRMAEELARREEVSVADAVRRALAARLGARAEAKAAPIDREAIRRIQERVAALPVLNDRGDDEILGYDENGAFR
ncbi:MAG: type II toxin-antitoxin system VapB family antitoxin [Geminicoccaceae bacterium]|nr:type II toxin-antitoxin system VapB family antitoxin [Geminicoccaceae bacterium]